MKFCDERIQKHLLNGGKIKKSTHCYPIFLGKEGTLCFNSDINTIFDYSIEKKDLTSDDWEIVEPEYDWDKIIKDKILCQFWDENEDADEPRVGYLTRMTAEGFYINGWDFCWKYCKPFNPAEFNIAKDLREYEK